MRRRYHVLDVFTREPLAGNPLAIVSDCEGLDETAMQRIAGEFNLSETVFLLPPRDPTHLARLSIFTPKLELPFAGHPTIGAAILTAKSQASDLLRAREVGLCLETTLGAVNCTVRQGPDGIAHARFEAPQQAATWGDAVDPAALADLLGLSEAEIGGFGHIATRFQAGVRFTFVPVRDLDALGRARLQPNESGSAAFYLYTPDPSAAGDDVVRTRMLATGLGIAEDPATGSAAVAFAGALLVNEKLGDGEHDCFLHQGFEMKRPSRIGLAFTVEQGRITATHVGGEAVIVAEGTLLV